MRPRAWSSSVVPAIASTAAESFSDMVFPLWFGAVAVEIVVEAFTASSKVMTPSARPAATAA